MRVIYPNHTVSGQVTQRQITNIKCTFRSPLIDKYLLESVKEKERSLIFNDQIFKDLEVRMETWFLCSTRQTGYYMSHAIRKSTFCICENKGTDQLCSNCTADPRLCFRYKDSAIPPLSKSKICSFYPSYVTAQTGLCRAHWKLHCWFSHDAATILTPCFL